MLKKVVAILAGAVLSVTVSANVQASTITVKKGDTLWDLAQTNNSSVKNIKILNHLTSDLIRPGDELTIVPEKQYTVKKGDTLWDIAMDHEVTVSLLKEWNQLHTDLIHPGLNLVIFEGVKTSTSTVAAKSVNSSAGAQKESAPVVQAPKTKTENTAAVPAAKTTKESSSTAPATETKKASPKEITVTATAYTATCKGCSGITSTGINLLENPDAKVISVDPSVIPLGSKVYVEGYGEAIAGDTGGAIKGNKIDVFIPSKQDAIQFGVKQVKVKILD